MAQDSPKKANLALILESQGLALALGEDLRRCGYNIEVYNKPDTALMPILRGRYQIIISEHNFKTAQMSGEDLIRSLRSSQLPKVDKLPVIILLKHHVDAVVRQLRKLGANGVLSQPIDPGVLHNMIQQLLDRPSIESVQQEKVQAKPKPKPSSKPNFQSDFKADFEPEFKSNRGEEKKFKTERRKSKAQTPRPHQEPYIEGTLVDEVEVVERTINLIEDDVQLDDLKPEFSANFQAEDHEESHIESEKTRAKDDGNYLGMSSPLLWMVCLFCIAFGVLSFSAVGMLRINIESILTHMLTKENGNVAWLSLEDGASEKNFTGISQKEYSLIRSGMCSLCKYVSPIVYGPYKRSLAQYRGLAKQVSLIGVDVDYSKMNGHVLRKGRLISQQDINLETPMVVIADELAREFFPEDYKKSSDAGSEKTKQFDPIGKKIRIGRLKLVVVGVLEPQNMQLVSKLGSQRGYDVNRQVLLPYTYYLDRLGTTAINELQIEPLAKKNVDQAISQVVQILRDNNKKETRYHVEGVTDWVEQAKDKVWMISIVAMLMAAIAFTIGSLAIMSLVHNATTKRKDHFSPRFQAFLDSVFISVVAGLLGAVLSFLLSKGLTNLFESTIQLSWSMTLFGVAMAVLVGFVTGQHTARRAPLYT